ncbi:MAG: hypothetical protein V3T83_20935, partial [Acidobacteriota bacterium]
MRRCIIFLLTALGAILAPFSIAFAHEIPDRVVVRAFVKPEGERLHLLVRVPLEAMRDLQWPTDEEGYLDLTRTASLLPDAATLWISNSIQLFEDGSPLSRPDV